ncbi:AraC family transcriptional regulator [Chryseobacterium sp.]|uniref:helix-turn-helix domain-containing protein n=1 Tax=Chryseobacterium sp. TaxID=1871047 RepID=UPI00289FF956|nr:AraC family transcriptional regulator [Chryseobacterium sp.]
MVSLFKNIPENDFYKKVHVFPALPVLKEMLLYAGKWNKIIEENPEQEVFMNALLTSLPNFCDENPALQIPIPSDKRLLEICHFINKNYQYNHSFEELAEIGNLSTRSLQRIFKKETGISLKKYVQLIKILKSVELIDLNQFTLSEIAYKIGYKSLSAFTTSYQAVMQSKPKTKK